MISSSYVVPSLALDFTTGLLDSRVSIARALNTATRTNSSGYIESVNADLPRFEYNPTTLDCRGLLIEEQRTNNLLYSEAFNESVWTANQLTITADATAAPSNTATADKLTPNTNNGAHSIYTSFTYSAGAYTISIYAKPAGYNWLKLGSMFTGNGVYFDIANGAIGTADAGHTATIEPAANGFYRCTVTWTASAGGDLPGLYVANGDGSNSFVGDGASGIYVWGVQLEAGAFVTSYIPTTTTALTRNADMATITGADFSGFWNAGVGGTTVTALPSTVSGIRPLVQFDDGTANEIIALRGNTTNPELYIVDGGAPQAQIDAGTIAANTSYTLTGWWQTNFCAARLSNGARVEDLTATIPTVTQMRIGSDGTNYLNGTIATIYYYNRFTSQIYNRRKNKVIFSVL